MRCPFLREAQVRYCRASAFRKMIVQTSGHQEDDRCTSPDFVNCPAAQAHLDAHADGSRCPCLQDALTQFCAAASVTKYIPYSEEVLSHCGTDSHKYCELFLALANPDHTHVAEHTAPLAATEDPSGEYLVEGIRVCGHLAYSANHMWTDIGSDGVVHIGIDGFLAAMIDTIDRVTFVTTHGVHRPTIVLTIHGVDLQMVFPRPVRITTPNLYLRSHPATILTDPYTLGWLFEGYVGGIDADREVKALKDGLVTGKAAADWMQAEVQRMSKMAHELSTVQDAGGPVVMADGGSVQPGFTRHLTREDLLRVFNEFFSPFAAWRTPE